NHGRWLGGFRRCVENWPKPARLVLAPHARHSAAWFGRHGTEWPPCFETYRSRAATRHSRGKPEIPFSVLGSEPLPTSTGPVCCREGGAETLYRRCRTPRFPPRFRAQSKESQRN